MSEPLKTLGEQLGEIKTGEKRQIVISVLPTLICRWDELVSEGKCTQDDAWKKIVELAKSVK
jgi:hypothetical protein